MDGRTDEGAKKGVRDSGQQDGPGVNVQYDMSTFNGSNLPYSCDKAGTGQSVPKHTTQYGFSLSLTLEYFRFSQS